MKFIGVLPAGNNATELYYPAGRSVGGKRIEMDSDSENVGTNKPFEILATRLIQPLFSAPANEYQSDHSS
jgi:hypothetical protein